MVVAIFCKAAWQVLRKKILAVSILIQIETYHGKFNTDVTDYFLLSTGIFEFKQYKITSVATFLSFAENLDRRKPQFTVWKKTNNVAEA